MSDTKFIPGTRIDWPCPPALLEPGTKVEVVRVDQEERSVTMTVTEGLRTVYWPYSADVVVPRGVVKIGGVSIEDLMSRAGRVVAAETEIAFDALRRFMDEEER